MKIEMSQESCALPALLREQVDIALQRRLTNINAEIDGMVSKHLREIIFSSMGLRESFGSIEFDPNNRDIGIRQHIQQAASNSATAWIQGFDWTTLSDRLNRQLELATRRAFERALKSELDVRLHAAVKEVVDRQVGAFITMALATADIQAVSKEMESMEYEQWVRLKAKYGDNLSYNASSATDLVFEENRLQDDNTRSMLEKLEYAECLAEEADLRKLSTRSSHRKQKKAKSN